MRIDRVQVGPLETNCWVVGDEQGGPVFVVDPGDDADRVLDAVGDRDISAVVLTHGHFDHLGAVADVVSCKSAPIAVHRLDAEYITSAEGTGCSLFGFHGHVAPEAEIVLEDGDVLSAGALTLTVIHTPGHTPGCICLLVQEGAQRALFSGDTLFAGGVGRTDFPRGSSRDLATSIATRLAPLPRDLPVHPGHGPSTTIGREATTNVFWPRA